MSSNENKDKKEDESLSFFELMQSMWAGVIGIQSGKNRERDFEKGKPIQFIMAGVVTTLIFLGIFISIAIKVSS